MISTQPDFAISRPSGKSNQQVVIELVGDSAPGSVFTYEQIGAELAKDCDREFDRQTIQQVIRLANQRLLREKQRELRNVRGVGYVIAHAREHLELAGHRNRRGMSQFKRATLTLQNVRLDEMTEQERAVHHAQLTINGELYAQQRRMLKQQTAMSRLISGLTHRVEQMEAKS